PPHQSLSGVGFTGNLATRFQSACDLQPHRSGAGRVTLLLDALGRLGLPLVLFQHGRAEAAHSIVIPSPRRRGEQLSAARREEFAERDLWNVRLNQSALDPENLITLAHFSVSAAMNLAKSEDEPGNTAAPRSANRPFNLESTRPALISLLSLSTISADVSLGAPMPCSALAS